jgi:hypothetical protein
MALGQKVELEIEGVDEPVTVRYSAIDLRRYEQQFHQSVLVESMSLTMLTYLGWSAAKRTGALNGSFTKWEQFDAACTSVRALADEEDEEGPTEKATSQDPSGDSSSA